MSAYPKHTPVLLLYYVSLMTLAVEGDVADDIAVLIVDEGERALGHHGEDVVLIARIFGRHEERYSAVVVVYRELGGPLDL